MVAENPQLQKDLEHSESSISLALLTGLLVNRSLHHTHGIIVLLPFFRAEGYDECLLFLSWDVDGVDCPAQAHCFKQAYESLDTPMLGGV